MRKLVLMCIGLSCFMLPLIGQETPLFNSLEAEHTGIDFSNDIEDTKESNILIYSNYYGGAGVAIGDLNNDGLQDIFFAGNLVGDKLYKNKGNLQFEEQASAYGLADSERSRNAPFIDFDKDGLLDLFVRSRKICRCKP